MNAGTAPTAIGTSAFPGSSVAGISSKGSERATSSTAAPPAPSLGPSPGAGERREAAVRIYLAARFDRGAEMRDVAASLARAGHFVTSRWIHKTPGDPGLLAAIQDIEDLAEADCLVSFTEPP